MTPPATDDRRANMGGDRRGAAKRDGGWDAMTNVQRRSHLASLAAEALNDHHPRHIAVAPTVAVLRRLAGSPERGELETLRRHLTAIRDAVWILDMAPAMPGREEATQVARATIFHTEKELANLEAGK